MLKHDCDNNCELLRNGKVITFRVIKPIAVGEEVTAHYGDDYCACPSLVHSSVSPSFSRHVQLRLTCDFLLFPPAISHLSS